MKLHVEAVGAGPPLVMLHGWAMHSGYWSGLLPQLARRHRVYCVDLPGHGHSRGVAALRTEDMLDALERSLAQIKEPLTVLGWSLGGMLAQAWALNAPERVRRLVLLATTPRFLIADDWPWAMVDATLASFARDLRDDYQRSVQRFLSLQVLSAEDGRSVLQRLRQQFAARGEPARAVLEDGLAMLRETDLRREVTRIAQPALVIGGDRDTLTPLGASEWLAAALPQGRLAHIRGAAHAPQLSHGGEFLAALSEFFREHP